MFVVSFVCNWSGFALQEAGNSGDTERNTEERHTAGGWHSLGQGEWPSLNPFRTDYSKAALFIGQ